MMMNGVEDRLEVYHTDSLLLGDNNGDYTISFTFIYTKQTELENEWEA